ncbi:MAG: colicin V synthesis protein [Rhodobiaceae bacterium]|nr:MAG: colicin V synthesis protein [Rhodobiaceae bacterium]
MTLFDIAVIGIMLVSGLLAMVRGFASEILSILSWVVAALAVLLLYPLLLPVVQTVVEPYWIALIVSVVVIFLIVYVAISTLTYRWMQRGHGGQIGFLDRSLGFIFGIARGLFIVSIGYLIFIWLVPARDDQPRWIAEARLMPMVDLTADLLASLAARQSTAPTEPFFTPQGQRTAPVTQEPQSGTDSGDTTGYKPSERRGLDQLFEATQE